MASSTSMSRWTTSLAGLAVLVVLFFGVNILAGAALRSARLDMTENNLYTISDGSKAIAAKIDEPIRLYFYYSKSLAAGRPSLQTYGTRVRELLEEYERAAGGNIILEIIDPEPFSDAEDEAQQAGLAGVPIGQDSFYFGLVGRNAVDGEETIPFFDPNQEQFLEYRVSRMIYSLSQPEKKVIGVLAGLPVDGGRPNPMQPQPARPWQIMREIRAQFEVQTLEPGATEIPADVDVLMVVHPKNFTDQTLYAIDQFILGGGNAVFYVDPNCEADEAPGAAQNPMAAFDWDRSSNCKKLFDAWGLTLDAGGVALDAGNAQQVNLGQGRAELVSFVAWLELMGEAINTDDPVTGRLVNVVMHTAGILTHDASAGTSWTPLLQTASESMRADAQRFRFFPALDIKGLLNEFESRDEPFTLAGRLSGEVPSAFVDGPPGETATAATHLTASNGPINVIVCADVDMLVDQQWVRSQRLGNISLGLRKVADNGDMLINALDNMTGSTDLISIRARGRYARPFTRVQELEKKAEREYLAEEQALTEKLRETEQKLNELQRARTDAGTDGRIILTPEQQAELERFQQQRLDTRRQLRQVQLNLRKDIEGLGISAQRWNTYAVPIALIVLAMGLWVYRLAAHRRDRRRVAHT